MEIFVIRAICIKINLNFFSIISIWCFEHSWFSGFSVADEVCPQCDWMGGKEAGHIPRTHCIPWLLQVRLNKQSLYLHNYCAGKVHKVNSWWWIVFPIDTALHACSRLFQDIVVHLMLVGRSVRSSLMIALELSFCTCTS